MAATRTTISTGIRLATKGAVNPARDWATRINEERSPTASTTVSA
jgi:glycerol uptake facilitator-like aquaporin